MQAWYMNSEHQCAKGHQVQYMGLMQSDHSEWPPAGTHIWKPLISRCTATTELDPLRGYWWTKTQLVI